MTSFFIFLWFVSCICFVVGCIMWIVAKVKKVEVIRKKRFTLYSLAGAFIFMIAGIISLPNTTASNEASVMGNVNQQADPVNAEVNNQQSKTEPQEEVVTKPDLELLEYSTESDEFSRYVVGRVKNNSDKNYSYVQVEISLYDDQGNQIGSTMDNVNNLASGGTWKFKAMILEDEAKKFEIKDITGF